MTQETPLEAQRKHADETNRMMRKFLLWGAVKLVILAAISAAFVYWYMY